MLWGLLLQRERFQNQLAFRQHDPEEEINWESFWELSNLILTRQPTGRQTQRPAGLAWG